ncbi:YitT family protein [Aureimonas mangrovi]|uniref:YitT family protein n=1 Tax=Aureimonas mangrovi TaxID=2758041 RepID=UPI00163D44C3|nr:YitT family protein [Aureimonas mangrovi]
MSVADGEQEIPSDVRRAHRFGNWSSTATHHSPWEDALGIVSGCAILTLGIAMLAHLGLLTGGMAGLAFVVFYFTGWNFGLIFFLLNLPFFALAVGRMGRAFTIKTAIGITTLSLMTAFIPELIAFDRIDPWFGAPVAGLLMGFGLLALFRHRSSAGGVGILAVYLQDRFGWRAGLTQLLIDLLILACAFFVASPTAIFFSVLGVLVLNLFLAINHRNDRYRAL